MSAHEPDLVTKAQEELAAEEVAEHEAWEAESEGTTAGDVERSWHLMGFEAGVEYARKAQR